LGEVANLSLAVLFVVLEVGSVAIPFDDAKKPPLIVVDVDLLAGDSSRLREVALRRRLEVS
jgi:hypothetical protein